MQSIMCAPQGKFHILDTVRTECISVYARRFKIENDAVQFADLLPINLPEKLRGRREKGIFQITCLTIGVSSSPLETRAIRFFRLILGRNHRGKIPSKLLLSWNRFHNHFCKTLYSIIVRPSPTCTYNISISIKRAHRLCIKNARALT